ncbi:MAG: hypothetical protein WB764_28540 [Xanthobacteraceae bacterium]
MLEILGRPKPPPEAGADKPPPVPQITSDLSRETIVREATIRPFTPEAPKPHPTPEKPKSDFWTHADKAVFGLCELLALLFGLPFGDDLYHDKPLSSIGGWHWFYLAIAVAFAVAGPMWPWLRTRPWAPQATVTVLSRVAVNPYVWFAALLALFFYGTGPELYRRATEPATPPTVIHATAEDIANATAPIQSKLDAAQKTIANLNTQLVEANRQKDAARGEADTFRQQIQNAPPQPPAPEDQIPVNWEPDFGFNWYAGPKIAWIRFSGVSTALAHIKDAYIISTLTGHKETLDLANPTNFTERWKIDQIEPIPSGAKVILVFEPKPPPSLPDFMSQWGAFEFHVVYDNKEYIKIYSQDYMNLKMTREMPGILGPRVTPRGDK